MVLKRADLILAGFSLLQLIALKFISGRLFRGV